MFTTKRIANGEFECFWNGEKLAYRIVNGSLGISGNGSNMYGIVKLNGTTQWVGTLQNAKKMVGNWLKLSARKAV